MMGRLAKQKIIGWVGEIRYFLFIFFIISLSAFTIEKCHAQAIRAQSYKLPLTFEKNEGQVHSNAMYFSRGNGYAIYFHPQEIVMNLRNHSSDQSSPFSQLKIQLLGAQNNPSISGKEEVQTKSNYLIGNNPNQWRTNVPNYAKVTYETIYPGIDAIFYGNQEQLEYDFCLAPGANPNQVRLHFEGAEKVNIDDSGNLRLSIDQSEIQMKKPIIYQMDNEKQVFVEGRFVLLAKNEAGFEISEYDASKTLIIDPIISYSTFLGGSGADGGVTVGDGAQNNLGIAVDCRGNAYICGQTSSLNYPVRNALQNTFGGGAFDACITKINPEGTEIIFSTYLGGNGSDGANAIAVDCSNNIYITGQTFSTNFPGTGSATVQPTLTGFQTELIGTMGNAFLTKLDPSGTKILYSTYCGGLGEGGGNNDFSGDLGSSVAVDDEGNAYFTGATSSFGFPVTPGAFQTTYGGGGFDAFIAKVNTKLTGQDSLIYNTFLGGERADLAFGIVIDSNGNAYVTGQTDSRRFPVVNALQPIYGGGQRDCFLTRIDSSGSELIFSTYCGGTLADRAFGIALDKCGNIYIAGQTSSQAGSNPLNPNFPSTPNAYQRFLAGAGPNAFITKFKSDGSEILSSTYFGGSNDRNFANAIVVDGCGNAYIVGRTQADNLPVKNASQPIYGGGISDGFVAKFNSDLSTLFFSTYLGGSSEDEAFKLDLDRNGNAVVAGSTSSINFPTTFDVFQPRYGGGASDIFVTKFLIGTPFIKCITPHQGLTTEGAKVIIRGKNFNNVVNVFFGEIPASNFNVVSENEILVESPTPGTGTVDVTIESAGGISPIVCTSQFSYKAFPPRNVVGFQKRRQNKAIIVLEWDAPTEGLSSYYYQVAIDPEFNTIIGTVPAKNKHIIFKTESCKFRKRTAYFVRTVDSSLNASDGVEARFKRAKKTLSK